MMTLDETYAWFKTERLAIAMYGAKINEEGHLHLQMAIPINISPDVLIMMSLRTLMMARERIEEGEKAIAFVEEAIETLNRLYAMTEIKIEKPRFN